MVWSKTATAVTQSSDSPCRDEDGGAEQELAAPNRAAQHDDAGPDDAQPAEPLRRGRGRQVRLVHGSSPERASSAMQRSGSRQSVLSDRHGRRRRLVDDQPEDVWPTIVADDSKSNLPRPISARSSFAVRIVSPRTAGRPAPCRRAYDGAAATHQHRIGRIAERHAHVAGKSFLRMNWHAVSTKQRPSSATCCIVGSQVSGRRPSARNKARRSSSTWPSAAWACSSPSRSPSRSCRTGCPLRSTSNRRRNPRSSAPLRSA